MDSKVCSTCKIEKPISEFYERKDRPLGYTSQCKSCISNSSKKSYYKHYEKRIEYNKIYNEEHKEERKEYGREYYKRNPKRRYRTLSEQTGINPKELDKIYNELFIKQEGKCAICGIHQSRLDRRLAIDHNHDTNEIRGLLCRECNLGISSLKEDVDLLKNSIKYLTDRFRQKKGR